MYEGIFINKGKNVSEDDAFTYAFKEILTDDFQRALFISNFAVPLMADNLNLENFAFKYAISEILNNKDTKKDFIDVFYSGNWIQVREDDDE